MKEGRNDLNTYLFFVDAEDGFISVGSHCTRRPLSVLFPDPLLGDGCEPHCLPRAKLHDADAALGGVAGGKEGGREGRR
jgi:hypothetical protein